MTLRSGIIRGAFSLGGARVASNLFNAAALLILARLLTPEDFGIVAIAMAILTIVQSSTELSVQNALIQKDRVEIAHIDTTWTISLIRAAIIVAFFVIAAWPLSLVYDRPDMIPVFVVSGVTGALIGLQNPHIWLATKSMRFLPLALVQFAYKGIGVVLAIAMALAIPSYWAIIAGNAVGALGAAALSYLLIPYRPRLTLVHWREIWAFSGWMFFNQLFETLNWRIDQLIIGLVVPKGALGIYAMADNLAVIPTRETIQPIRHALFPGLANLSGDLKRLTRSHLLAQSSIAMLIAPLGIGLALVAEPAVALALGDQWNSAVPFVEICAIYYALGTFSMGLQPVAMALGKTRLLFIRQLVAVCIKLPLIIGGLWLGGLMGAAIGRLASEMITVLIEFLFLRHLLHLPLSQQLARHSLTLFALAVMAGAVTALHALGAIDGMAVWQSLMIEVAAGAFAYATALAAGWWATGKPDGPVSELAKALQKQIAKRRGAAIHAAAVAPAKIG